MEELAPAHAEPVDRETITALNASEAFQLGRDDRRQCAQLRTLDDAVVIHRVRLTDDPEILERVLAGLLNLR